MSIGKLKELEIDVQDFFFSTEFAIVCENKTCSLNID